MSKHGYPELPNLKTVDVASWLKKQGKKNPGCIIFTNDLVDEYNITLADAANRLSKLRSWGILKYFNVTLKARGGYVLTMRGRDYLPGRWKKKRRIK